MTDPIEAAAKARMRITSEFAVALGRPPKEWDSLQDGTRQALIAEERRIIAAYLEAQSYDVCEPPSAWQPIETAARDGTRILAIDADGDMMVVEYYVGSDGRAFWEIARNELEQYFAGRTLTHWMPLPEPPKESK